MKVHEIKSKSTIRRGNILHKIVQLNDFPDDGREDLSYWDQPLQVAVLGVPAGKEFKAHRHIVKSQDIDRIRYTITQEAWVVIAGFVEVEYYDVDDVLLEKHTLGAGDCSITYAGGHAYRVGSSGVKVYEFKTGPYYGQKEDKVFIECES
jgi:hypothetical protein